MSQATKAGGRPPAPATVLAGAHHYVDRSTGALTPPIVTSTTYARDENYRTLGGRIYARDENPTFEHAETVLAHLEGATLSDAGGIGDGEPAVRALLFSSGMAAATSLFAWLTPDDHAVAPACMYFTLRCWLEAGLTRPRGGITFVDMTNLEAVKAAIIPGLTKLVWVETPANPTWEVSDIAAIAAIAHAAGALVAVDSTVSTPILTQPLALGADWVMHSATKYLNGHGDVLAGALCARKNEPSFPAVARHRKDTGNVPGPQDAYLLLRGMRTLELRVKRASSTAQFLCERLASHPKIVRVRYPGLASFPGHAIATTQMKGGFGGMFSIDIDGGTREALAIASKLSLFARATSLGSTESLVEHRRSVEGSKSAVPPCLLRFSVGLEAPEDLLADLHQALA